MLEANGPVESSGNSHLQPLAGTVVLRLDIKVAKDLSKQLVIDRKTEDPWVKAELFCKENNLTEN